MRAPDPPSVTSGAVALRRAPGEAQGATAGLFFAWFDAGVGLGGPVAGVAATSQTRAGRCWVAGALVALAPALVARRR